MKTTKFVITVCAIILGMGLLFGEKPADKKDFTINLAQNMLKSVSRDIVLTDSQKIALQISAKEYEVKMKDMKGQANTEEKKTKNKDVIMNYRAKLNQILTKEQQDTIQMKRIQRAIDITTKNNQK